MPATKSIEMIVGLKVPDTTAITALQTLQRIGFSKTKNVKRYDYYKFSFEGETEKFKEKIAKVDILVNANKHSAEFSIKKDKDAKILVKNINDDGSGILSTLKNRLGFKAIKNVEKGVLWSISAEGSEAEAKKTAEKAAKELLVNENYQEYKVL